MPKSEQFIFFNLTFLYPSFSSFHYFLLPYINLKLFPSGKSLVREIPAGDRKIANLFLQCMVSSCRFFQKFFYPLVLAVPPQRKLFVLPGQGFHEESPGIPSFFLFFSSLGNQDLPLSGTSPEPSLAHGMPFRNCKTVHFIFIQFSTSDSFLSEFHSLIGGIYAKTTNAKLYAA